MFPQRRLLYHRGVDDHVGTYITDYVFSGVCLILCVHLLIRIQREKKKMTKEQTMTSSCRNIHNLCPWNWPKQQPTPVTMSTYAVLLLGFSNFMMALLGGLTHQYLQTVEPYTGEVEELRTWLIIWRGAASFSACLCLSLLVMVEQLIVQEGVIRIPRVLRIIYYVIIFCTSVVFFCYNYVPLSAGYEDPFSVRQSFVVSFGVMIVYGIVTIVVLIHNCCCRSGDTKPYSADDVQYSPAYSVDNRQRTDRTPYRREIYSCCKTVAVHCNKNDDNVPSRKWELFLTFISPWIFVSAGVFNHFLKHKCADSDNAFEELGCPLPDSFNHNAAMHVIQIFSIMGFFIAENLSMTRRRNMENRKIRRITTSSTLYNDVVNSCTVTTPEMSATAIFEKPTPDRYTNNNKPCGRDDVVCEMTSDDETKVGSDVISLSSIEETVAQEPRFPTFLSYDETGKRNSLYDNLSTS